MVRSGNTSFLLNLPEIPVPDTEDSQVQRQKKARKAVVLCVRNSSEPTKTAHRKCRNGSQRETGDTT